MDGVIREVQEGQNPAGQGNALKIINRLSARIGELEQINAVLTVNLEDAKEQAGYYATEHQKVKEQLDALQGDLPEPAGE